MKAAKVGGFLLKEIMLETKEFAKMTCLYGIMSMIWI